VEQGSRKEGPVRALLRSSLARAVLSLLLVMAVGIVFNADGTFFRWDTHRDMLRQVSVFGMLACGMTLVIIAGGIDLSVGSLLGLSAVLFSLFSIQLGWAALPAAGATVCLAAVGGTLSGSLIARFRIQPFIATLAMMVFARGVAKLVSGGQKVSTAVLLPDDTYQYVDVPKIFDLLSARVAGDNIAVVALVLLGCIVFCWLLLSKTPMGRHIYAIGGNEEAARYAGVPIEKTTVAAYCLSGLFCGIAGICQAAQELQGDPEAGSTYELTAIAMVVIGGTSLRGGQGSIWLTALGILIIGYLEKILSINAVGEETRLMLTGVIIVVAVLFQKKDQ
jgi:ribose/xylose/arabinose/galactoside ABC-type transport system permease subunit